jgi:hypothetical protein
MTPAERQALALLADCGSGATGPALAARGVAQVTLDRLVARGLVTARLRTFANPPGLTVTHYWLKQPLAFTHPGQRWLSATPAKD